MKPTPPSAKLLQDLCSQAKKLVKAGQGSYLLNLEALCKLHGFSNRGELERAVHSEERKSLNASLGIELGVINGSDAVYRVQIGKSIWALRLSKYGPQLQLQERPYTDRPDARNTSDLGIFQAINRSMPDEAGSGCWNVTRYGHQSVHRLDFMSDEEVRSLSRHFGIPFWDDVSHLNQTAISEKYFLKSSAFIALRNSLRLGINVPPGLSEWSYGLTPAWAHCVGIPDRDLSLLPNFVDSYFKIIERRSRLLIPFQDNLHENWARVSSLGRNGSLDPSLIDKILALAETFDDEDFDSP